MELGDMQRSGRCGRKPVRVRLPLSAPKNKIIQIYEII